MLLPLLLALAASAEPLYVRVGAYHEIPVAIDENGRGRYEVLSHPGPLNQRHRFWIELQAAPRPDGRVRYAYRVEHEVLDARDALLVESAVLLAPGETSTSQCGQHLFSLRRQGSPQRHANGNEPTSVLVSLPNGRDGLCAIETAPGAQLELEGTMAIGPAMTPRRLKLSSTLSRLDKKRRALAYDLEVEGIRYAGKTTLDLTAAPKRLPKKKGARERVSLGVHVPLD